MSLRDVFKNIKVIKDYPKKGIIYRHIGPLLNDPTLFKFAIKKLCLLAQKDYDIVCGLDARGFIVATAVQYELEIPQVMIRKESKIPGEKYTYEYRKEYGYDIFELEKGAIKPGQRVLIVDDLMASGGSLLAACNLVELAGGVVKGVMVLVEFKDLDGRNKICKDRNIEVNNLFSLDSFNDTQFLDSSVTIQESLLAKECIVKEFTPNSYFATDNLPILMWHPTMKSFAQKLLQVSNMRASYISWDYFPDGSPNFTFEPSDTLINKDIVFVMSMYDMSILAEQLIVLLVLPRQLINSLTIIIPYLGSATHERVDYSGQLATVEPILKILSSCIPMTKTGPPILRVFDIHALQERFYVKDTITMKLMSAIPVLLSYLKEKKTKYVVAFPDDGAYKRFKYFFSDFPQVICNKIRDGDVRKISIREKLNYPEDCSHLKHVIIVDDLVQSGETLLTCANALKENGFTSISAYATHAVFPNNTWKRFVNSNTIDEFIVTNTNAHISDLLEQVKPFTVLDVQMHLCTELSKNNDNIKRYLNEQLGNAKPVFNVYVASTNNCKLMSVYESTFDTSSLLFGTIPKNCVIEIYSVGGISSGVPAQPYQEETVKGVLNRIKQCTKYIRSLKKQENQIFVSIENGIYKEPQNLKEKEEFYIDIPVIAYTEFYTREIKVIEVDYVYKGRTSVRIPKEYEKYVKEALKDNSSTFGSIIQKKLGTKDWHKSISGRSRKNILLEAMHIR